MTAITTRAGPSSGLVLLTMSLGVLVAQIDTSVVTLALKQIGAGLDADVRQLQWVVDAYNLVYASLLLSGGTLGDLFGRRRIFAWGIALFTFGSLLCAAAPNVSCLIAGRALTGLGAALEFPASLAILSATYPIVRERMRAIGVWASCNGLAFAIGPTLGGVLVDAAGWRSIFLVVVPFSMLTLILAFCAVPESTHAEGRRLAPLNQLLATAALAALALTAIEGPHWGWSSMPTLACAASSLLLALLFVAVEAPTQGALIPFALMRNRVLVATLAVAACMTFGMYGMLFLAPLYLQVVAGATAPAAGLAMLPLSLSFLVVSHWSGRLANAVGPRIPMVAGMALMGLGEILLAWAATDTNPTMVATAFVIVGCGLGLNTGPTMAVAVGSAPPSLSGTASGLVNTARMIGATLGVAVLGAVFAAYSDSSLAPPAFLAGLRPALVSGGAVELLGALAALGFIRRGSLKSVPG
jgi:MFS transporter, DHA2 family, methylenomycin A resistance protein